MANLDLRALLDDWEIALKAQRKSPKTLIVYTFGVNAFLDWCAAAGRDQALTKDNVNAWIADGLDRGWSDSTAITRQSAVRRFSAWLTAEEELDMDPLLLEQDPAKYVRRVAQ